MWIIEWGIYDKRLYKKKMLYSNTSVQIHDAAIGFTALPREGWVHPYREGENATGFRRGYLPQGELGAPASGWAVVAGCPVAGTADSFLRGVKRLRTLEMPSLSDKKTDVLILRPRLAVNMNEEPGGLLP